MDGKREHAREGKQKTKRTFEQSNVMGPVRAGSRGPAKPVRSADHPVPTFPPAGALNRENRIIK